MHGFSSYDKKLNHKNYYAFRQSEVLQNASHCLSGTGYNILFVVLAVLCYPVIVNLQMVEVAVAEWVGLALVEVVQTSWLERCPKNHQIQDYLEDAVAAVVELPVVTMPEMLSSVQRNHRYLQHYL